MVTILNSYQLDLTLRRLAHQLIENHYPFSETCFIGMQPRGLQVSDHIIGYIKKQYPEIQINYGKLDITFYRDDVRNNFHVANKTDINFSIEGRKVVLIDDVLYTGRTIRAALDALLDFGRSSKVELCTLVDRRFNRQLPIQPDYVGKYIDTITSQKVKVLADKNEVIVY